MISIDELATMFGRTTGQIEAALEAGGFQPLAGHVGPVAVEWLRELYTLPAAEGNPISAEAQLPDGEYVAVCRTKGWKE